MNTIAEKFDYLSSNKGDMRDHMQELAWIGRDRRVLEIGFRGGVSACAFLHGDCRSLLSIDINDCSSHVSWLKHLEPSRFSFMKLDSRMGPPPGVGPVDVLMIDGDHSYEGAMSDLRLWGHLAPLIVMHDTNEPKFPGVRQARDEWVQSLGSRCIRVTEHRRCHGLSVIEVAW